MRFRALPGEFVVWGYPPATPISPILQFWLMVLISNFNNNNNNNNDNKYGCDFSSVNLLADVYLGTIKPHFFSSGGHVCVLIGVYDLVCVSLSVLLYAYACEVDGGGWREENGDACLNVRSSMSVYMCLNALSH